MSQNRWETNLEIVEIERRGGRQGALEGFLITINVWVPRQLAV
jgi:hypothetical protein